MEKSILTIKEPAREIPVRASVDVLVVGGGPAGVMAARAAACESDAPIKKGEPCKGPKVMLIESRGFLGGNLTIGLPILAFLGPKGDQIIKGLPQEFITRMQERDSASEHIPCKNHMSYTVIDPEMSKTVCQEMLQEVGVDILMYVFCVGVLKEGNKVTGVIIESKKGREAILAKTVIDATGDGDVAFRAGVECHKGDKDGGMQPPTLMYKMIDVNMDEFRDALSNHSDVFDMDVMPPSQFKRRYFITVGLRHQLKAAEEKGLHIPVSRTILITALKEGEIWVNMTRINGTDSTSPDSYTACELIARKQMYDVAAYLKAYVPGFENARIDVAAPFTGIRESRVIVGKYILTEDDILKSRRFDDAIAVAGYPVDIHHAKGGDCTMLFCKDSYDIPYGCLVPANIEGLLVAGRCSSMSHEAMAATRVMSTCMALGEAAGRAARLAMKDNVLPSQVDVQELRKELKETGAYLI
ncbi:MAG: FAD-dependent oxidoreductase [Bacteroidales bacterium]